jgi:hypothetical protein
MNLIFDTNGCLFPNEVFKIDNLTFETTFAYNERRKTLFRMLESYIFDLQLILNTPLKIWVNGSYTTQKVQPNDIDLVTFVDYQLYRQKEIALKNLLNKYRRLDAYYAAEFPIGHRQYFLTVHNRNEWYYLYNYDDRSGLKKGFIELNF